MLDSFGLIFLQVLTIVTFVFIVFLLPLGDSMLNKK